MPNTIFIEHQTLWILFYSLPDIFVFLILFSEVWLFENRLILCFDPFFKYVG